MSDPSLDALARLARDRLDGYARACGDSDCRMHPCAACRIAADALHSLRIAAPDLARALVAAVDALRAERARRDALAAAVRAAIDHERETALDDTAARGAVDDDPSDENIAAAEDAAASLVTARAATDALLSDCAADVVRAGVRERCAAIAESFGRVKSADWATAQAIADAIRKGDDQ